MGISGHMLGERKLRRLRIATGLDLDKAVSRNGVTVGRVIVKRLDGDCCIHYDIDLDRLADKAVEIEDPIHWTSCPR